MYATFGSSQKKSQPRQPFFFVCNPCPVRAVRSRLDSPKSGLSIPTPHPLIRGRRGWILPLSPPKQHKRKHSVLTPLKVRVCVCGLFCIYCSIINIKIQSKWLQYSKQGLLIQTVSLVKRKMTNGTQTEVPAQSGSNVTNVMAGIHQLEQEVAVVAA